MLMGGKLPPELTPIGIMQYMGWSWRDYMDTPEYIVELAIAKMNAERRAAEQRASDQGTDVRMAGRQARYGRR